VDQYTFFTRPEQGSRKTGYFARSGILFWCWSCGGGPVDHSTATSETGISKLSFYFEKPLLARKEKKNRKIGKKLENRYFPIST